MGNISSLPRSIAKERSSFEKGEYAKKFDAGPTASRPGPMLLKQAAVAVKLVSMEKGSMLRSRNIPAKQNI